MNRPVMVTGACGMLGSHVVRRLVGAGHDVVAVDLRNDATARTAASLQELGVRVAYADLTDAGSIAEAVAEANPHAVIHLAAVIPPTAYVRPALAERVNVGGTANLVAALEALPDPGRLVLASSTAVYGSRNGAKDLGLTDADTPLNPCDVYGHHKVQAEALVRGSSLPWAILRIGGIMAVDLVHMVNKNSILMDAIIPVDNRIHTISVEETAEAFANAADADCLGLTLLIAGDDSHMIRQSDFGVYMRQVAGLGGTRVTGRPGDPDNDDAWFMTDWMDTRQAREVLKFGAIPMAECVAMYRAQLSPLRVLLRPFSGIVLAGMALTSPYRGMPGRYADPWSVVSARFGAESLAPAKSS